MVVKSNTEFVFEKMEELCSTLLKQKSYKLFREMIDQFNSDVEAVQQYEHFMEIHQHLYEKEQKDIELSKEEIEAYDQAERALYDYDVIRQYLYAQREFNQLHTIISQFFTKTLELNRLPSRSELKKAGCGSGH
ncbi:YlbF family regulator [Bacillus sp. FJAT-50079]|uniref:YlbF family regulator n=1 Tax=Bacillus sp. FJAT-50079 TaxID=2833577 RepID=UPI001BCA4ACD|nr:YlbF family regulator [Bacillus sp. FJAT-50079]MBS4209412.1 YlbF family regulator [Bacillus sp. FJAT-50079]